MICATLSSIHLKSSSTECNFEAKNSDTQICFSLRLLIHDEKIAKSYDELLRQSLKQLGSDRERGNCSLPDQHSSPFAA